MGITLDTEQAMARKVSGIKSVWQILAPLRESPFPGVHRDGGTSAGLFHSQLHRAASDLCKKGLVVVWGIGGRGVVAREEKWEKNRCTTKPTLNLYCAISIK